MATIYGARQGNSYGPRLELVWSVVSQSVANNTTRLKVISRINFGGTVSWSGSDKVGSTTANGSKQSYTYKGGTSTTKIRTLSTNYFTIYHNSDGTANIPISGTFNVGISWSGTYITNITASGTISLPTINRGVSNISYKSGWYSLGGSKVISYTKLNSNATLKLEYRYWLPKEGVYSSWYLVSNNYVSGTAFSISQTHIDKIYSDRPNGTVATVEFRTTSYLGTILVESLNRKVDFPLSTTPPTVSSSFVVEGVGQSLLATRKEGIPDVHNVSVTLGAQASNSAYISYYEVEFAGRKYNYNHSSGKLTIKIPKTLKTNSDVFVTAYDSRGSSTRVNIGTVKILSYLDPTIGYARAYRVSGVTENPIGTSYKVSGNIGFSDVFNGTTQVNKPWWSLNGGTTKNYSSTISSGGSLSIESEMQIVITYGDSFTKNIRSITLQIPVGQAPLVIGKNCIGVGTVPPADGKGIYLEPATINNKQILYEPILEDFTSKITVKTGLSVSNLKAIRYGKHAMISFTFKPTTEGFTTQVLQLPPEYCPAGIRVSGSLDMTGSYDVRDANVQTYLTSDGAVGIVARPIPVNAVNFTFNYISV